MILCSHVLPGVERHIDRAAILGRGRMLASGSIDELRQAADLPLVMRLRTSRAVEGIAESLRPHGVLARQAGDGRIELEVPVRAKLAVLRSLMADPETADLDLEPPTLESLYAHFDATIRDGAEARQAPAALLDTPQGVSA